MLGEREAHKTKIIQMNNDYHLRSVINLLACIIYCILYIYSIYVGLSNHKFYHQRKFSSQASDLRTSAHGWSCHHVNHSGRNSSSYCRWEQSIAVTVTDCVFTGMVAPGVAKIGFVFPRLPALILKSCCKKNAQNSS